MPCPISTKLRWDVELYLPEADMFPRSISVIGERKESLKAATTPNSSPIPEDGGSKKKFKWNIKVRIFVYI